MNAAAAADRVRLESLVVNHFRNIEQSTIRFPADGIVIVGDNGQGKTNLLEAIGYLKLLRSMRGARDRDLIRFGAEAFHISARISGAVAKQVGVGVSRAGEKRTSLDGAATARLGDALGAVPSICVSPSDVALVAGGPAERRRAMDIVLALTDGAYLAALRTYRAALMRRNAVLRSRRGDRAALKAWEPALAAAGAILTSARRGWVAEFGQRFSALVATIGEQQPMSLAYNTPLSTDADLASHLAAALESSREQDEQRGVTQCGPHRDDLSILLGGRSLRVTGSAGQQRTAAIALRLVEAETYRSRRQVQPMLLLDDPFAELDRERASRVLALLEDATAGGAGQAVLCVPRHEEIPAAFTRLERWCVRGGDFSPSRSRG